MTKRPMFIQKSSIVLFAPIPWNELQLQRGAMQSPGGNFSFVIRA